MSAFLDSDRWLSFHLRMSSQQLAAEPLSADDTVLHDENTRQRKRILMRQGVMCVCVCVRER